MTGFIKYRNFRIPIRVSETTPKSMLLKIKLIHDWCKDTPILDFDANKEKIKKLKMHSNALFGVNTKLFVH